MKKTSRALLMVFGSLAVMGDACQNDNATYVSGFRVTAKKQVVIKDTKTGTSTDYFEYNLEKTYSKKQLQAIVGAGLNMVREFHDKGIINKEEFDRRVALFNTYLQYLNNSDQESYTFRVNTLQKLDANVGDSLKGDWSRDLFAFIDWTFSLKPNPNICFRRSTR